MLSLRKIKLPSEVSGLSPSLIPRETLRDCEYAESILNRTKKKVETLLRQAEEDRENLLEQAREDFWHQANTLLQCWEAERQAMTDALESRATGLVNEALSLLLEEVAEPERLSALLRQLSAVLIPQVSVILRCCPQSCDPIQRWLDEQGATHWRLRPDASMAPHALTIETQEGDFLIDWPRVTAALLLTDH